MTNKYRHKETGDEIFTINDDGQDLVRVCDFSQKERYFHADFELRNLIEFLVSRKVLNEQYELLTNK